MTEPPARVAYIRTTRKPEKSHQETYAFMTRYVKQRSPTDMIDQPRHRFLFGASTISDFHVLDVFLWNDTLPAERRLFTLRHLRYSDLELRISQTQAATKTGRKTTDRCNAGGIAAVVCGTDDSDCDEIMLQECDYIIDDEIDIHVDSTSWFWNTSRPGIPQDSVLTNPKFDVSQYDVSKTRLGTRYAGYAWRASSGGHHGNLGDWRCIRCGGKCKRGKCKVNPPEDRTMPDYFKLPAQGSAEWREMSASDACQRLNYQYEALYRYTGKDRYQSIETFSGE